MTLSSRSYDVVVIGAGASGLFCAAQAGYRGRKVALLEHTNKAGRKILMSGGGRCNFTHMHSTPANFLSANPHFCKSALSRYRPQDFVELVERHGVEYHEKTPGQLFCNDSSRAIVELLLTEAEWAGVELQLDCAVTDVQYEESRYLLQTSVGAIDCESLVIATGGLSIPNAGATAFAYELAEQFGLELTERRPALVPFTLQPAVQERLKELSGISQSASVSCGKQQFDENILVTHRGISGPGILQISSYWNPGAEVSVDLLPRTPLEQLLIELKQANPAQPLERALSEFMTRRLASYFTELWSLGGELGQFSHLQLKKIAEQFHAWTLKPSGTEGYRKAEVTLGGIATSEIVQNTFEAKRQPGLYFIGESLDVTGHLGGHNFQWAWASGFCCGQSC